MTSGRGEAGGGGGEVDDGSRVEGRGGWFEESSPLFIPTPVTSFGGAMATNLTTPLDTFLTIDSAVATSTPISEESLIDKR